MNMKKITALVLALMLLAVSSCALADHLDDIKKSGKLVVGAEVSFAPFEFYMTGEDGKEYEAGFEMDLARQIAEDLGVELEIADQQFNGLITALQVGEVDLVISGMTATEERRNAVDFSDTYYVGEQPFVVREADVEKYKTYDDIKGKMVGAQLGTIQQTILETQFPECESLLLPKVPTLLMELLNGNIEGVICSRIVATSYMNIYDGLAFAEIPVDSNKNGVGVAVAKGDDNATLLAAVNATVERVVADGTYDAWVEKACAQNAELLKAQEAAE